jgi:hypothetical protein
VSLLSGFVHQGRTKRSTDWKAALHDVATAIVEAVPTLSARAGRSSTADWLRAEKSKPADKTMEIELLASLRTLGAAGLRADATAALIANPSVFDPPVVLVPALAELHRRGRPRGASDPDALRLWVHAAEFLLARSEQPPAPPADWRQNVKVSCRCDDCRDLQVFARDRVEQAHRFRVRKDRRQHLHQQIQRFDLDMTHVTERKGSPQTLVCTKTRRTYERRLTRHAADCASMGALLGVMADTPGPSADLGARLAAARERS